MTIEVSGISPRSNKVPRWVTHISDRKHVVGYVRGRMVKLMTVGMYYAASNMRVGAAVWLFPPPGGIAPGNGFGLARGYGYDRASHAIELALRDAGIEFTGSYDSYCYDDSFKNIAERLCGFGVRRDQLICV